MRLILNSSILICLSLITSCNKELPIIDTSDKSEEFNDLGYDAPYIYNETYNGRNGYVTYYPGNIPIILSIPHGGDMLPEEIPDRTYGVSVTDSNTIELGNAIKNYFYSNHNIKPYIIINNLDRSKLDANRDKLEAAQGNLFAERAFDEFHYFINDARQDIINKFSTGILFDIHGHGVNPDGFYDMRTWIGYLLSGDQLDNSDDFLNENILIENTSIYSLLKNSSKNLSNLIRGPESLGSLFEQNNYTALPSSDSPGPEGMRYFSGGYNTFFYGTNSDYNFSAIQLEFPYPGLRDTPESRDSFSSAFVNLVNRYFVMHIGVDLFSL